MIRKTEALAMRIWPHSNTSQIVSWLTPDEGRISTLHKGALRSKSAFLGQCDLFYQCELLYYTRSKTDLFIAKEVSAISTRTPFRNDWRAACLASYWNHLLLHISVALQSHGTLYRLANQVLDHLATGQRLAQVLLWGEVQLLSELGLAPQLHQCALCQTQTPDSTRWHFMPSAGGVVCSQCASSTGPGAFAIQADVLAIFRRIQSAHQPLRSITITPHQLSGLQMVVASFQEYHLEINPATRLLAFNTVRSLSATA